MDSIQRCYERVSGLLGPTAEPIEVLRRVEAHRQYWRPEKVRVILLAESHVVTTAAELTRRIIYPVGAPSDIPTGFVRFVYCLGYGENSLLDTPIVEPPNTGTPQFWKIFMSCAYGTDDVRVADLQRRATPQQRIQFKIALLSRLRNLGVWLVDTSLLALYAPRQVKPRRRTLLNCLQASWDEHVGAVVRGAGAARIICVGRGVASALGPRLSTLDAPVTIVAQPNAHLTSEQHSRNYKTYYQVVQQAQR